MSENEELELEENKKVLGEEYTAKEDIKKEEINGEAEEKKEKEEQYNDDIMKAMFGTEKKSGNGVKMGEDAFTRGINKHSAIKRTDDIITIMKNEEYAIKDFLNKVDTIGDLESLEKGYKQVEEIISNANQQREEIKKNLKPYEKDNDVVDILRIADYLVKEMSESKEILAARADRIKDNEYFKQFSGKQEETKTEEAELAQKRKLKSHPSFKQRALRAVAGTLAITAIAGVSAKKLADAHTKQGEKDKTEAYDKGYDAGYEKGHEIGLEDGKNSIVFESMKDSAENQTTEGAITDTQHRANVNERLQQIKQEIADRYDDIDVNDITISTERDSNGKLQIEITNKDGKQIPVDQEKENEIKTFIEDYQNPMLDGTTTEQQKETLQKELEEKNNEEVQNTITVLPEKEDDTER